MDGDKSSFVTLYLFMCILSKQFYLKTIIIKHQLIIKMVGPVLFVPNCF